MELIIALALFVGMIVSWFVLPSDKPVSIAHHEVEVITPSPVQQSA